MHVIGSGLATPSPVPFTAAEAAPSTIDEWLEQPESAAVRRAWDLVTGSTEPVLLTGPAGTGKSHLLTLFLKQSPVRTVVLASTGISALQIGGQTLHAFFRFPPRVIVPGDLSQSERLHWYAAADVYVVDEASMLRADLIDGMDVLLRRARGSDAAFGGARVLLVGDAFQLAPVVPQAEAAALSALGYTTPWFFGAKVFERTRLRIAALDHIHRQRDPAFADLLSRVRTGRLSNRDRQALEELVVPQGVRGPSAPLTLTTTRAAAAYENASQLAALAGPSVRYEGQVGGDFPPRSLPVPRILELKPQARVVFVRNDISRRWANGTMGTVVACQERAILVRTDDREEIHLVQPVAWDRVRYVYDRRTGRMAEDIVGRYTQLPCLLGWAITIHRSQGMTLDHVRVDLASGAFAAGQAYVALSRVRSREGLELVRPVRPGDVWVDPAVHAFMSEQEGRAHEAA